MNEVEAPVVFTDIRGFTKWSDETEVFLRLNDFIERFMGLIKAHFPGCFVKGLGDGAMIVEEIARDADAEGRAAFLEQRLQTIKRLNDEFERFCKEFGSKIGHRTNLELGWGLTRGRVKKIGKNKTLDYIGANVNKAARLCDIARPSGVVIDRNDYDRNPTNPDFRFFSQVRRLSGLEEVDVWVTPEIESGFVPREKLRETPEVHVAGVCVDTADRRGPTLLFARRNPTRRLFPGKLEGCGGQLARSESFTEGVRRHFRTEMALEVRVLEELHCFYEIDEHDEPYIPGIRFLCERESDTEPRSPNHSEYLWLTEKELRSRAASEFVGNLRDEALGLFERYKSKRTKKSSATSP